MQLQQLAAHHFEMLGAINARHKCGGFEHCPKLDEPERRLLEVADRSAGNDYSTIARFCPKYDAYVVDPAMEGRITCLAPMLPESGA